MLCTVFCSILELPNPAAFLFPPALWCLSWLKQCPDFYPVSTTSANGLDSSYNAADSRHVLKASFDDVRADFYAVGTYDQVKGQWNKLENGLDVPNGFRYDWGEYHASRTFFDPKTRRRILLGWVPELDSVADDYRKGWASLQAIPRSVTLDMSTAQQLLILPVDEVKSLRGEETSIAAFQLAGGQQEVLNGVSGSQVRRPRGQLSHLAYHTRAPLVFCVATQAQVNARCDCNKSSTVSPRPFCNTVHY